MPGHILQAHTATLVVWSERLTIQRNLRPGPSSTQRMTRRLEHLALLKGLGFVERKLSRPPKNAATSIYSLMPSWYVLGVMAVYFPFNAAACIRGRNNAASVVSDIIIIDNHCGVYTLPAVIKAYRGVAVILYLESKTDLPCARSGRLP